MPQRTSTAPSAFSLLSLSKAPPDEDEFLGQAKFDLIQTHAAIEKTHRCLSRMIVCERSKSLSYNDVSGSHDDADLATSYGDLGTKLTNVAHAEAHPVFSKRLHSLTQATLALGRNLHAEANLTMCSLADPMSYQATNCNAAKVRIDFVLQQSTDQSRLP